MTNQADRQVSGKTINLALQGGGAHGAFTWGVLDRLLQDERIAIEGIAATSAGAMNATVFAYGLTVGGRQGARTALTEFWRQLSKVVAGARCSRRCSISGWEMTRSATLLRS